MKIMSFMYHNTPRLLLTALVLSIFAFTVTAFLWPVMAMTQFDAWAQLFKWTLATCFTLFVLCYFAALFVQTKKILRPDGTAIQVDINAAAYRLVHQAKLAGGRRRYTRRQTAQVLLHELEAHRTEFSRDEQAIMQEIVYRAAEILQEGR